MTAPQTRAMAGRTADVTIQVFPREPSVAFFGGAGCDIDTTPDVWVLGDLDLTNLDELHALTGDEAVNDTLVTLYWREGPSFVRRLRGAFALALWDRRQRSLLLAVDHFGIRRLYYVTDQQRTAFASRSQALLAAPGVATRVDPVSVYHYLNFGYVPAPASIFRDVRRLAPGHLLLVQNGRARLEPYWDMAYRERPLPEAAAALYRLTEAAVAQRLRETTPKEVGAFLSGGTDSSTVLGLMSRLTGERINAFSIGFAEERYNELHYAELSARHFCAAHYTKIVGPDEALACLPRLVEAYDEPFGNSSAIGTFFCAELARECGVRLLFAGDGGDEIFGGNERYRTDRIFARYHRIPAIVRRGLLEPLLSSLPDGSANLWGRAQRYIQRANLPNPERFYFSEFFFARAASEFLSPDFQEAVATQAPHLILKAHYDRLQGTAELNRLLYLDLKLTIGDNDLLKVTRTAEMAGIAVRFPLLDLSLVEFTGTLPAHLKVRGLEKRYLFKRAFRSLLPPETLAKRKHGFGVPTGIWLKSHSGFRALARETLLSSRGRQRGYFRGGALERLIELHAADITPYYGDLLWTLLTLELWHRRYVDVGAAP